MIKKPHQSELKAIVLYGSHARLDADGKSDFDVCVFTQHKRSVSEDEIVPLVTIPQNIHLSLSSYCQTELSTMLTYGSLFLWHLKLEGRTVYGEKYLEQQFTKLRPFDMHHSEIAYHREIFRDMAASPCDQYRSNEFDLALLFTIARNTCMLLAHKAGTPAFGRQTCYRAAVSAYHDLPLDEATYLVLSRWKLVYERGLPFDDSLPSSDDMECLLARIKNLLEYADAHTR